MNIHILKSQKVQLITLAILVAGLAALIYLVQVRQIFKPKATTDLYNAFSVSSNEPGKTVTCTGSTCQTDTLNINIKLEDINALLEP